MAALGIIGLVTLWITRPILVQPGLPWGTDVHGHLARVWYAAKMVRESGDLPAWFPYWYNGTPFVQYYPPLVTYVMLPLQLLLDDVTTTYLVFCVLSVFCAGAFAYWAVRLWMDRLWALLAAALYVTAPYTVYTIFDEGNLPRALSITLMPLAFGFTLRLLTPDKPSRKVFLGVVLSTAALVLAHHQQAAMVLLPLLVLTAFHLRRTYAENRNLLLLLAGWALGILLCAFWLFPALTRFDYPNVPDLSLYPERIPLYSVGWNVLSPGSRTVSPELVYLGLSLVIPGIAAAIIVRNRRALGILVAGLLSLSLSFGVNNPLYGFLPIATTLLPERFLNTATLLFAVLGRRVRSVFEPQVFWHPGASIFRPGTPGCSSVHRLSTVLEPAKAV